MQKVDTPTDNPAHPCSAVSIALMQCQSPCEPVSDPFVAIGDLHIPSRTVVEMLHWRGNVRYARHHCQCGISAPQRMGLLTRTEYWCLDAPSTEQELRKNQSLPPIRCSGVSNWPYSCGIMQRVEACTNTTTIAVRNRSPSRPIHRTAHARRVSVIAVSAGAPRNWTSRKR